MATTLPARYTDTYSFREWKGFQGRWHYLDSYGQPNKPLLHALRMFRLAEQPVGTTILRHINLYEEERPPFLQGQKRENDGLYQAEWQRTADETSGIKRAGARLLATVSPRIYASINVELSTPENPVYACELFLEGTSPKTRWSCVCLWAPPPGPPAGPPSGPPKPFTSVPLSSIVLIEEYERAQEDINAPVDLVNPADPPTRAPFEGSTADWVHAGPWKGHATLLNWDDSTGEPNLQDVSAPAQLKVPDNAIALPDSAYIAAPTAMSLRGPEGPLEGPLAKFELEFGGLLRDGSFRKICVEFEDGELQKIMGEEWHQKDV